MQYKDGINIYIRLLRIIWITLHSTLYKIFPGRFFNYYRIYILKIFGAKIGKDVIIYSSARIWAPWNMEIGNNSCIGPRVNFYNQSKISIGNNTIISQDASLISSTHDFEAINFELVFKNIKIGNCVWIAVEALIGPGAIIQDGTVVGARTVIFNKTESWSVYVGNPGRKIKNRRKIGK